MKVRKFVKRNRRTAGIATGHFVCNMSFPETDEHYDLRPFGSSKTVLNRMRKFVRHHVENRSSQQTGAWFTISAEIRAENGGLRRQILATWHEGESIDEAFKLAYEQSSLLVFEDNYSSYETEI